VNADVIVAVQLVDAKNLDNAARIVPVARDVDQTRHAANVCLFTTRRAPAVQITNVVQGVSA
jgi:hypothetical protein